MVYLEYLNTMSTLLSNRSEVYLMADIKAVTHTSQNASPDLSTPTEPDVSTEAFTIDGICGVY